MSKWTTTRIRAAKGKQRIACLTAYDYLTARLIDDAGLPMILVGDSLATTALGYDTTLPVTMDAMLHHTAAVVRGTRNALVLADMPFMSYQESMPQGLGNAGRFIKDAGADAVKIEGGSMRVPLVRALVENGIPVVGHIGLTPQSVKETGGYKVQGRDPEQARALVADARALSEAGVFALVLECIPATLGAEITAAIPIPTIGIGAGRACDGQVLVCHDMLGFNPDPPRFVKQYTHVAEQMRNAFDSFRSDVESGSFPAPEHTYN